MKPSNLIAIVGLFICCLICLICAAVPAVSAETFEETYTENIYKDSESIHNAGTGGPIYPFNFVAFPQYSTPDRYKGAYFLTYDGAGPVTISGCNENYNYPIECYESGSNQLLFSGHITYDNDYNLLGVKTHGYFWINIDYIAVNNISVYNNNPFKIYSQDYSNVLATSFHMGSASPGGFTDTSIGNIMFGNTHGEWAAGGLHIYYQYPFETKVSGEYNVGQFSKINVERKNYISNFTLYDLDGNLLKNDYQAGDIENFIFPKSAYRYTLQNEAGTVWEKILTATASETGNDTISVLASVKNIQDYSVIGDSTISFVSDTENITRTMPNGYDLFTLAKNTWYNVSASAAGFTAQQEYESNLWTGNSAIDVWMIPITEESNETVQMNWYVSESNPAGPGTLRISDAVISINSKTILTDSSGYGSTILNRSGSISYTVKKDGYNTYSRSFSPNWETYTFPTIDEHITLLKIGESIGEVTPVPTPDTRTSNQKAESAFNILFDNLESIVQLAVLVLIISLIGMLAGGGKKR